MPDGLDGLDDDFRYLCLMSPEDPQTSVLYTVYEDASKAGVIDYHCHNKWCECATGTQHPRSYAHIYQFNP
jgi:hypothetical protein